MTDYRATPEVWSYIESFAGDPRDIANAILELRARVEALEANSKPTPNDRQIRSSLVERVATVIADPYCPADFWHDSARAAIREVAAWLREQGTPAIGWATRLQQEAER